MKTIVLGIDGMQCGMCESHVNDAVRRVAKVKKVSSSHTKNQTEIVVEDNAVIDEFLLQSPSKVIALPRKRFRNIRKKDCLISSNCCIKI